MGIPITAFIIHPVCMMPSTTTKCVTVKTKLHESIFNIRKNHTGLCFCVYLAPYQLNTKLIGCQLHWKYRIMQMVGTYWIFHNKFPFRGFGKIFPTETEALISVSLWSHSVKSVTQWLSDSPSSQGWKHSLSLFLCGSKATARAVEKLSHSTCS